MQFCGCCREGCCNRWISSAVADASNAARVLLRPRRSRRAAELQYTTPVGGGAAVAMGHLSSTPAPVELHHATGAAMNVSHTLHWSFTGADGAALECRRTRQGYSGARPELQWSFAGASVLRWSSAGAAMELRRGCNGARRTSSVLRSRTARGCNGVVKLPRCAAVVALL